MGFLTGFTGLTGLTGWTKDLILFKRNIEAYPAASCRESSQKGMGSILISLANPAASCGECARMLVQRASSGVFIRLEV